MLLNHILEEAEGRQWQSICGARLHARLSHGVERMHLQGLVWAVSGQVHPENLFQANWSGVTKTLPVLALAFVYQNVVPVVCSRLEVSQDH